MASATWNCSRLSTTFLCTPYNHAPCHFMQSHIRKVYACLAVTCHLHFWQNDWGLLRATAVTQGWNGYRNKVDPEKKIFPLLLHGSNLWPFSHESGTLTTELSPPLPVWTEQPPPPKQRSVLRSDWPVWTEHPSPPDKKQLGVHLASAVLGLESIVQCSRDRHVWETTIFSGTRR